MISWLLLAWAGCQMADFPVPVRGSSYRMTEDQPAAESELRIDVLQNWSDCATAGIDDLDGCLPHVDRKHGEVGVSFVLRDPVSRAILPRSIDSNQITISHDRTDQSDFELIPHQPVTGGQLFILIIDGSSSMYDGDQPKINRVYEALRRPEVVRGFFPTNDGKTGVVLLRFATKVVGIDGGEPRVLKSAAEYRQEVNEHLLKRHGGFTHLYAAARYAVTDLLKEPAIAQFRTLKAADPTIVLLTDGFNNEVSSDRCRTNAEAERLPKTLEVLRKAREGVGASQRATVFTVGLGRRYARHDKPQGFAQEVSVSGLCGQYAEELIDPTLEADGRIDHVSLGWIAEAGGGIRFVRQDPDGLAEVFRKATSPRHRWYELKYKVEDNFHHRQAFEVKLRLRSIGRAETTFEVKPSPWIDAPSGVRPEGQRWTQATPLRNALALLMPLLGLLVLLVYLGPAWFNVRRALTRRARPRPPVQPPPEG